MGTHRQMSLTLRLRSDDGRLLRRRWTPAQQPAPSVKNQPTQANYDYRIVIVPLLTAAPSTVVPSGA